MTNLSEVLEIRKSSQIKVYIIVMALLSATTLCALFSLLACAPRSGTTNATTQTNTATPEAPASSTRDLLNQSDTAKTAATDTQPTTYVNTDLGFSVIIPTGWYVKLVDRGININQSAGWAGISITKHEGPAARAAIYIEDLGASSVTNKTFYYKADATGVCPKPWYMYYWMDRPNDQGQLIHQEILLREAGDNNFMFLTTALTEEYNSFPFKDVAASFKLLGE